MKFEQLLQEYRIPVATPAARHYRSGWLNFLCPFCPSTAGASYMGYSIDGGYTNCWQCGWHRLIDTIVALTNLQPDDAYKLLDGMRPERRLPAPEVMGKLTVPAHVGPLQYAHKKYLESRGFCWKTIVRLWKVAGIGISVRLGWRIYIPILAGDQVVSWTTRSIDPSAKARYISASRAEESLPHKTLLYGEEYARHGIIINEGPMGAWAIGPGAVATCGVAYSREQLLRMAKYPVRAIAFDNEAGAQQRARKLCDDLEVFPGTTFNVLLSAKSADLVPKSEVAEMRRRFLE